MSFLSALLSFLILTPVFADTLGFKDVLQASSFPNVSAKALTEAKDYAHFRKFPEGVSAQDYKAACLRDPQTSIYCALLQPLPKSESIPALKPLREKYFSALLKLDDVKTRAAECKTSRPLLKSVVDDPNGLRLEARSLYWMWVCATLEKDTSASQEIKERLWRRFPLDHHTFMVLEAEHDARVSERLADGSDLQVSSRSAAKPAANPWIEALEALVQQHEDGTAAFVSFALDSSIRGLEPEVRLYIGALMAQVSRRIPSTLPVSRILVPLIASNPEMLKRVTAEALFPNDISLFDSEQGLNVPANTLIAKYSERVNPSLLSGLIYYESGFNPRAGSSANAFGLLQLLTTTATDEYRKESGDASAVVTREQLQDPRFTMKLGVGLLERLKTSLNSWPLALASYNAGETGVRSWLGKNPHFSDPQVQIDLLLMNSKIEIHVSDYVSSVLGKANWYSALYPTR